MSRTDDFGKTIPHIKADVLVAWPENNDYPLWRQFIHDNRQLFNEVIVVFTDAPGSHNYRDEVRKVTWDDNILCIDSDDVLPGQDWRNVAMHTALNRSRAEWLWFTEQDFFPKVPDFFDSIDWYINDAFNVHAVYQANRMHPCSIFIKRITLERTGMDFGIVPDVSDHFSMIQTDLQNFGVPVAMADPKDYEHYNGLSHNWRLVTEGQIPVYEPERFYYYLTKCSQVTVPKITEFDRAGKWYIDTMRVKSGE